jgi:S1-C subfamily serine protease
VRDHSELHTVLSRLTVGGDVPVDVWRPDGRARLRLRAEAFPVDRAAELTWRHLGLALVDALGVRRTPYVAVENVRETSQADRIGLRRGLAVVGLDGRRVRTVADFDRELARGLSRGSVLLAISDGRATYRVPLEVE